MNKKSYFEPIVPVKSAAVVTKPQQSALEAWALGLPLPPGWTFEEWQWFRDMVFMPWMTVHLETLGKSDGSRISGHANMELKK